MSEAGEWREVYPFFGLGFPKGFDRAKEYRFSRRGGEEYPVPFRLDDVHPAFNVAGLLYWHEAPPQ